MSLVWSDFRYCLRTLGRNPGFGAVVILIVALGIAANTAIFSIADAVLVRPLPFRDAERLFAVQESVPRFSHVAPRVPVSAHHFLEWRKHWRAAEHIAILGAISVNLTSAGDPMRLNCGRVSADLFPMLGIQPQLGRNFLEEEDHPGRDKVVILTDALWRRRVHADPSVLGQKIVVDGVPFEVVGVLSPETKLPKISQLQPLNFGDAEPDLWKPMATRDEELSPMGDFNYGGIVRLKQGISPSQALDELNAVQAGIASSLPEHVELRAALVPLQEAIAGRSRDGLLLLLSAVGAVLLIVCVNIANLLLSRATGRRREFAIRTAIGASAVRLARQVITESLLIAMLGGALGVALAFGALGTILANAPADLPRLNEVRMNGRVLGMAFLLSAFCGVLFGLLPALRSSRADPQDGLKAAGRTSSESHSGGRLRSLLVTVEVGLGTLCLVAAGLLLNSFVRLMRVERGFDVERVVTVHLNLPSSRYPDRAKRAAFLRNAVDRLRALPGVNAAAVSNLLPLAGEGSNNIVSLEGSNTPEVERPIVDFRCVSEDYFRAMGIPLRQGRLFNQADRDRGVTLVSALTAERFWPGQNPIGKRFYLGVTLLEVIGVAGDVRGNGLQKAPGPTVYIPYWQRDRPDMSLILRTAMDPASIASAVRGEIRKLDAELPVPRFQTMQQIVSAAVAQRRFQLTLVLVFAGVALVLASLGIYGVVSYSVAQRRGEMGIRMALGATAAGLQLMVIRQGLAPVLAGLAGGIAGALAVGRILRGLLFEVTPADPLTLASVAVVLLGVAAVACYIPAFRVTRADPLAALRYE